MKGRRDEAVNIDLNGKMLKFTAVYPELFSGYPNLWARKQKRIKIGYFRIKSYQFYIEVVSLCQNESKGIQF
jgi:hypothetical protein